jgi:ribose transport system substrate-binding protein
VDWVYGTYEVDCISNPENTFSDRLGANTRCEPPSAAKSQISKPAIPTQMAPSANAGTPTALPVTATPVAAATPAPGATPITAKAQCSVANPADYTLSTAPLDMTAFRKPGPYTIGYSDSGDKRNLFDAYIISWARFEASIHSEIKSLVVTDAKNDYKQQILDIQQHIDNKVDLLLINPVEQPDMSAMVSAIQTAMQANIPVLLVNHRIPAADKVMSVPFVGPDDFKVGCVLAQEMITTLDGEGIVYQFLGIDSTASDKARRAGTDVIFNLYPTSMIRFANRASNLSESVIRTALALDPTTTRIDGVLGYDGWITVIAEDQLTKQGLPVVPAVGDQYAGLAKFTAKYKFRTAQVHIPANMGATAIRTALLILNGQAVPWFTEAPIEVIPAQSLDQYDLKNIPENDMLGDALGLPESFRPENPLTP